MHWRFWERKNKNKKGGGEFPTASSPAPKTSGPEAEGTGWLPLAGSAQEILGLQQLIGNQAVVRLFAPEKSRGVSQGRKE
jgi:hypothetical protein